MTQRFFERFGAGRREDGKVNAGHFFNLPEGDPNRWLPGQNADYYWGRVAALARQANIPATSLAAIEADFRRAYAAADRRAPLAPSLTAIEDALTRAIPAATADSTVLKAPEPTRVEGCFRVQQASYAADGDPDARHVIIRHMVGQEPHFTALTVNPANAPREIQAFINAYARGGAVIDARGQPVAAGANGLIRPDQLAPHLVTTQDAALDRAYALGGQGGKLECPAPG